ncbi:prolyl-tRNA synthetase [Loktanella sp. 3ANDIMAR09]|uniref:YbaK/EbsC family protein n=1 Tax=Loktanella sp. 3ANDIMAR09 TaxID=1225657 RepID=UPI0006F317B3|nr:YbaK/EbsC family protein [Loktanella sp. 3ANDIMAR09]KQI69678.1 prolyl-tRNA synthetase [Loktanella sp. 3ANDIMAR09]
MSKSLKRVTQALTQAGLDITPVALAEGTRTAQAAADAQGCAVDQIAKSIIFQGSDTGNLVLFITAGGQTVDPAAAAALTGEPLTRADPVVVRKVTGFAIGGVSPVGHLTPPRAFMDPRLMTFDVVYAAAGTPHHIFAVAPADLLRISGAHPAPFTAKNDLSH